MALAFGDWRKKHHIFTLLLPPPPDAVVTADGCPRLPVSAGRQPPQDGAGAVVSLQHRRLPSDGAPAFCLHSEAVGRHPAASASDTQPRNV